MAQTATPAEKVIGKLGGVDRTAARLGLHRTTVTRWLLPRDQGGTGGLIPAKHQGAALAAGRDDGLEPADFFDDDLVAERGQT